MKWMMTMHPQTSPALKISWKKRPISLSSKKIGDIDLDMKTEPCDDCDVLF